MKAMSPLRAAWRSALQLPDRRPIYEWATCVELPRGVYSIQGHFNVQISRYLIKPFDALQSDRVRIVTLLAPVRSGKSLLADIWVPWIVCNCPGPTMWNMNTDILAKRHAETRVMPVLRGCKAVREFLPEDHNKQRSQDIIFRNGSPLYVQGPSSTNLQGVPVQYLIEDELRMRSEGKHQEATARLGDYEELHCSKLLNISQAGESGDDMDLEFLAGTQEEWMVQCDGCQKYFEPVSTGYRPDGSRFGLIWDRKETTCDPAGLWIPDGVMKSVRYESPCCGHKHSDCPQTQKRWNDTGDYEVRNHQAGEESRSFHIYATCTRRWALLAKELCQAQNAFRSGNIEPLRLYSQKRDAKAWSDEMLSQGKPMPKFELTPEILAGAEALFLTCDRQAEGLHWGLIWAWFKTSSGWRARRIWYGKLFSEVEIEAKAKEYNIPSNRVGIDCRHEPGVVYGMCARQGWIAFEGDDAKQFLHQRKLRDGSTITVPRSYSKPSYPDPESGKTGQGRSRCTKIRWCNTPVKDHLQRFMDMGLLEEPRVDPPTPAEIEYHKQMRGQWKKRILNRIRQRFTTFWVDNGNDHARDCSCMQLLFAKILKFTTDLQAEAAEDKRPDAPDEEKESLAA